MVCKNPLKCSLSLIKIANVNARIFHGWQNELKSQLKSQNALKPDNASHGNGESVTHSTVSDATNVGYVKDVCLQQDAGYLDYFLYKNRPCVVIGRYQNPYKEIHLRELLKGGIPFLRRKSGGGTVFHDLGNVNYTFFAKREHFNKMNNSIFLLQALERAGIPVKLPNKEKPEDLNQEGWVEVNQRNDLIFKGKKISGSAYRIASYVCYHHGTLLIDSDLSLIRKLLNPPKVL